MIRFKRLHKYAKLPVRAHSTDAGFDLFACFPTAGEYREDYNLRSRECPGLEEDARGELYRTIGPSPWHQPMWGAIPTGIAVEIPPGYVGLICPRSGAAVKVGRTVVNAPGIIDSGYRGEIKVILHALVVERIRHGDAIAQLVVVPCLDEAIEVDELSPSDRGENGFGSTH